MRSGIPGTWWERRGARRKTSRKDKQQTVFIVNKIWYFLVMAWVQSGTRKTKPFKDHYTGDTQI